MYLPEQFEETRLDVLHGLMKSHPFAMLVTLGAPGIVVNHLPFLIDGQAADYGTLRGHVARANPVWQQLSKTTDSVVVFQGPASYISPSWYPSKHAHGKAVPTWNYAVVQAYGRPRAIEHADWLHAHLTQLTEEHESGQALPWKITDAPSEYTDRMIRGIVGIEMVISRMLGKWKVSQNRTVSDRLGVVAGLQSRTDEQSRAMAALVMQRARQPDDE